MTGIVTTALLWAAGKSFAVALILTPVIRDISRSFRVVDKPGSRKVHVYPIPRIGGIAIAAAYVFSLLWFGDPGAGSVPGYSPDAVWNLIPGAAVIFTTGLLDDLFGLRPVYKVLGQLAAGGLVFWNGVRIDTIARHPLAAWLSLPLTLLWILVTTNALNLIDGLDGLCAGVSLVATLTLFAAAVLQNNTPLAYATLPLAGALLGFLCYNFNPATVFLGDSGALLLGFLLGCYGMIWTQKTTTLLSLSVPLVALSIPLIDASLSVLRRILSRQPIFGADRRHVHHRLLDRGLTPRRAVFILYVAAAVTAVVALLMSSPIIGSYHTVIIIGFCAASWIGIRQLRYAEFNAPGRRLFGGDPQVSAETDNRLEQLANGLEQARTEERYWEVLVEAAKQLGWSRVRWTGARGIREQALGAESKPQWSYRIPLGDDEAVEVEGPLEDRTVDLTAFGETVSRTFAAKPWRRAGAAIR
jgi:UDP-GlcNAc:undecaprenyl-phosphate/decaprenyl-phosphate GlcNAc-1-phosphate transferase